MVLYEYGFLKEDTGRRFETWEFSKLTSFQADSLEQALVRLDAMGWELVTYDGKRYIMKRSLVQRPDPAKYQIEGDY